MRIDVIKHDIRPSGGVLTKLTTFPRLTEQIVNPERKPAPDSPIVSRRRTGPTRHR